MTHHRVAECFGRSECCQHSLLCLGLRHHELSPEEIVRLIAQSRFEFLRGDIDLFDFVQIHEVLEVGLRNDFRYVGASRLVVGADETMACTGPGAMA